MWTCKKCNAFVSDSVSKCICKQFFIINEEDDEYSVYAYDEEGAATIYAKRANSEGDGYLIDNKVEITVNSIPFSISAEADVRFYADKIKNP